MTFGSPQQPPPPRSNGCLWGCLIAVLIVTVPPVLAATYGVWYLWQGYRHNPAYRLALDLVRKDGLTGQVLGDGVEITGMEGNVFSWVPGLASDHYELTLEGSKGEGHLVIGEHHSPFSSPTLDRAILTGPDGRRYDLMNDRQLPSQDDASPDTSI
jgi:hypothetical protein